MLNKSGESDSLISMFVKTIMTESGPPLHYFKRSKNAFLDKRKDVDSEHLLSNHPEVSPRESQLLSPTPFQSTSWAPYGDLWGAFREHA